MHLIRFQTWWFVCFLSTNKKGQVRYNLFHLEHIKSKLSNICTFFFPISYEATQCKAFHWFLLLLCYLVPIGTGSINNIDQAVEDKRSNPEDKIKNFQLKFQVSIVAWVQDLECVTGLDQANPGFYQQVSKEAPENKIDIKGLEEERKRTGQIPVGDEIRKRWWNWFGHTLRKQGNSITKKVLDWNPQGQDVKREGGGG